MEAAAGGTKQGGHVAGPSSSEQARPNAKKNRNRSSKKQKAAAGAAVEGGGGPQAVKSGPSSTVPPTKGGKAVSSNAKAAATAPYEASGSNNANAKRKRRKKEAAKQAVKREGGTTRDGSGGAAEDPVGKAKLKVVVRRLPPNVPEAILWKAVSPWVVLKKGSTGKGEEGKIPTPDDPREANVDYAYFVQGKLKHEEQQGANAESGVSPHVFSRAYVRFTSTEALVAFHRGFDGHLFRDSKGNEYSAVVEFAPFQRTAGEISKRKKADPRQGTVEEGVYSCDGALLFFFLNRAYILTIVAPPPIRSRLSSLCCFSREQEGEHRRTVAVRKDGLSAHEPSLFKSSPVDEQHGKSKTYSSPGPSPSSTLGKSRLSSAKERKVLPEPEQYRLCRSIDQ